MAVGVEFHLADISEQRGTEAGLLAGSQWHIEAGRRKAAQLEYRSATLRPSLGGHRRGQRADLELAASHTHTALLIGQGFSNGSIEGMMHF